MSKKSLGIWAVVCGFGIANADPFLWSFVAALVIRTHLKKKELRAWMAVHEPVAIAPVVQITSVNVPCNCKAHRIFGRFRMAA